METATALFQSCLSFGLQRPILCSDYCSISWVTSAEFKAKLKFRRRSVKGSHRLECRASSVFHPLAQLSSIQPAMPDDTFCAQEVIITPSSTSGISHDPTTLIKRLTILIDLDPATAKIAIGVLGPLLPGFAFLFVLRIIMSWYPKLPVGKFPYVIAYAPTEPILKPTRKLIPPVGGVDVTPVVWFGLLTFVNEILVGPQGLLVLLSQQTLFFNGKFLCSNSGKAFKVQTNENNRTLEMDFRELFDK